jgi:triosephosphate isomerase
MPDAPRYTIGVGLKMYMGHRAAIDWMGRVADIARAHPALTSGTTTLFALPSFVALVEATQIFADTGVKVGAQDLFWDDMGPFTGEVSGTELAEIGCLFAEVGHAERRNIFGENDEIVSAKTAAAYRNGLTPVLCVGEDNEQDPADAAAECIRQLDASLAASRATGVTRNLILAYEPKWAIGAPQPAGSGYIRVVGELLRAAVAADGRLSGSSFIYGGSAGPGMLEQLGGTVDGLFLGRSSHDTDALERVLDEVWDLVS